ncbi:hypothetical protein pv_192 [Pithovirus sibericum]|uniref:Uncharacterized protein n=1 Tax=Pithovirus sibericum TaxID=1450746 RepID=W5S522_9VIRU|nr:hypothetical protein pv_192 [Pithovirus sibericum]AHH01759.1 hypothetical protein pv_192 [Pithovirus sibericum]
MQFGYHFRVNSSEKNAIWLRGFRFWFIRKDQNLFMELGRDQLLKYMKIQIIFSPITLLILL